MKTPVKSDTSQNKGSHSRRQIKKEATKAEAKQRDSGVATPSMPFKRGATSSQQIEIAKLQAARSFEESCKLNNHFTTSLMSIQKDFETRMELAKMWDVKDPNHPIFTETKEFMGSKRKLSVTFSEKQSILDERHRTSDAFIDNALGNNGGKKKRLKSSGALSITTTATGSGTPLSSS